MCHVSTPPLTSARVHSFRMWWAVWVSQKWQRGDCRIPGRVRRLRQGATFARKRCSRSHWRRERRIPVRRRLVSACRRQTHYFIFPNMGPVKMTCLLLIPISLRLASPVLRNRCLSSNKHQEVKLGHARSPGRELIKSQLRILSEPNRKSSTSESISEGRIFKGTLDRLLWTYNNELVTNTWNLMDS